MITFVNSNIFKVHDIKLRMSTKIFNNIYKKTERKTNNNKKNNNFKSTFKVKNF